MHSRAGARARDADPALAPPVPRRPHLAPGLPAHRRGRPGARRRVPELAAVVLRRPPLAGHRHRAPTCARPATSAISTQPGRLRGRRRRDRLGPHAAGRRVHARPTAVRTACPRLGLRRLGRHDERRPRQRQGRERLVRRCSSAGPCSTWPTCADHLGRDADAAALPRPPRRDGRRSSTSIAWDGAWYARAFDDDGRPVGVAGEERHQINLNPQTWSVIGEVAPADRAEPALRSVRRAPRHQLRPRPARGRPTTAATSACAARRPTRPGPRRTAASSATPTPGSIVAAAMLGRGDEAYRLLPADPAARPDGCRPLPDRALRLLPEHLRPRPPAVRHGPQRLADGDRRLDVRRRHPVDPGHPARPTTACALLRSSRPIGRASSPARFRGVAYEIEVQRAGPGSAVSLSVDGRPVEGCVVPLPVAGTTVVTVDAVVG